MSRPKPQVTIVGLGLIGASLGMALRQTGATYVVGHDKDLPVANQARKREAADKVEWNLVSACEGADLVILATPIGGIKPTLEAIGPYLRPGCVVLDTATLKAPVLAWAAAHLPEQVHFVGGDPVLRRPPSEGEEPAGPSAPRADLFKEALFCLVPSPQADPAAVKLVADLATLVGAQPFFMDAAEHDGLMAAMDQLPAVASLALLEMAVQQPSWKELRKVAGTSFEQGTQLGTSDPVAVSDLVTANRESVVRYIDALIGSLQSIRSAVAEGDSEALAERFQKLAGERDAWLRDRATGKLLEGVPPSQMPSKAEMFDAFLGSYLRKSLTGQRDVPGRKGRSK